MSRWAYTRKTAPTSQVIDLGLAKLQCRISLDDTNEDDLLNLYIETATSWAEDYAGISGMTQTWQISARAFARRFWLPRAAPLASVTHVKYYDTSNALQTLSASVYTTPSFHEPACLALADGQSWPSIYTRDDAVQIEYVTGVTAPENTPAKLRQAVQLLVGHWFANRESVIVGTNAMEVPLAAMALCDALKVRQRDPEWH